ncbi:transporter substrate-binding domain-containing protein [uncultured Legionella sp.]|uniref:transporter substrate-binding domain-containing protein n=1 Tax=uncultured Legionella sp. TaxID=210934 RepID=UPI00261EF043|nr:transporter substrate-binding domain-containing protein [uncultured Legionella sp.]
MAVRQLIIAQNRMANIQFSIPYLINNVHVIGPKKLLTGKFDMGLLHNQKIGITDEAYFHHIAELKLSKSNVNLFSQDDELVDALNKGVIGVALVDTYTASYWNINSSSHIVDLGKPIHVESEVAIAINPNDAELLERINWALTSYRNSQEFIDDYNKYLLYF